MSGFQRGDRVKITVEWGEVQQEDARWLTGFVGAYRFTVPLDGPGVAVERYDYPAPGSNIPDQPGHVVGKCGHRVAVSEWRSGFRVCERCPYPEAELLIRQAARYLRTPATTVEDQAVRLERLAEAAGPIADLLEAAASHWAAVRIAGAWRPGDEATTVARALTGGGS